MTFTMPIEWRSTDQRGPGWSPFGDRFPRAAWTQWPDPVDR